VNYHLTSFGCQMNDHDAERMRGLLESLGYREAAVRDDADLLLVGDGPLRVGLQALARELGIGDRARARPAELSGGELARAGLAVALANDPTVVLADEPTGELDHANALRIVELLRRGADHGGAVIVMTHSRAVASGADRVIALRDGQVVP